MSETTENKNPETTENTETQNAAPAENAPKAKKADKPAKSTMVKVAPNDMNVDAVISPSDLTCRLYGLDFEITRDDDGKPTKLVATAEKAVVQSLIDADKVAVVK